VGQKFAAMVACVDPRFLHGPNGLTLTHELAIGLGFRCFPVTRAGGVQDLVRPVREGHRDSIIRDLMVSIGHGAQDVVLVNHEDCKAYPRFSSLDEERRTHVEDLRNASQFLRSIDDFQEINIRMFLAELEQRNPDIFIFKEIRPV